MLDVDWNSPCHHLKANIANDKSPYHTSNGNLAINFWMKDLATATMNVTT
jgi:hypothetical protein